MNFLWFLIFSLIVFLMSLICYESFRSTTLYALAIGGAVNANFFHAGNYPIMCFGLPFGIDSIIYSLFAFCIVIMLLKTNKKEAYILSFSSIIAIMFSASMQLVSNLFTSGSTAIAWQTFLTFTVSVIASLIAIWAMIEIINYLKKKNANEYILLILGMLIVTFINSLIYYPLATIINQVPENIIQLSMTSIIGKLIAVVLGILAFYLMNKIEKVIKNRNSQKSK